MKAQLGKFGLLSILLFSLVSALCAQADSTTATLQGRILDQSGAALPGASVTVTNEETGVGRALVSDDEGSYRAPLLQPGSYEVRVEMSGFSTKIVQGVHLTLGSLATLDVVLELASIETEIIVSGTTEIIEVQRSGQSSAVSETEINNLPTNGRNYLEFSLLTPGISGPNTMTEFGVPQAPTSGISFGGQDQRSTAVLIDGADNVDAVSNGIKSTLSQEAIHEFQVNRNSFSAEFGRARGGVINILTKSGTNKFSGNLFYFGRDNSLDARNAFAFGPNKSPIDPPFRRHQWGGTVGGPIVQNQTFFFASYERLDRDESKFVSFMDDDAIFKATPSQLQLFGFLGAVGSPQLAALSQAYINPQAGILNTTQLNFPNTINLFAAESGTFPFKADQDTVSFKLDHQFSSSNSLSTRVSYTDNFSDGVNFGGLYGVSNGMAFDTSDFAWVVSDHHIFSPSLLNELRFQVSRRIVDGKTNDPNGPEMLLDGVAIFGRQLLNPTYYNLKTYEVSDNVMLMKGSHNIKLGFDLLTSPISGFAEAYMGGQFRFAEAIPLAAVMNAVQGAGTAEGLAQMLATPVAGGGLGRPDLIPNLMAPVTTLQSYNFGLPVTYVQSFGDPNVAVNYSQLAFYLQDSWEVSPALTFNLGVRYDIDFKPSTTNISNTTAPWILEDRVLSDNDNIAPRVGFAWSPANSKKVVVRGGYGMFYGSTYQALGFVGRVLSGQLSQAFMPITGLPGLPPVTSAHIYGAYKQAGVINEQVLGMLGLQPGTTPAGILPMAPDAVNPISHQASLGLEFALGRDWALDLNYNFNHGVNLVRTRDINVREVAPGMFTLPGLDPRYIQIGMVETSGSSVFHGVTSQLRKRFSAGFSLNLAYSYGKSIDDTTDFTTHNQAHNQLDLAAERGLSTFDLRQRLAASAILQSPVRSDGADGFFSYLVADWTLSPIITLESGRPFNILTGFDTNGDGHANTDRPKLSGGEVVGRNTGIGPNYYGFDARLSRKIMLNAEGMNLEFIFEAFNLFNEVNYAGVNGIAGATQLNDSRMEGSNLIPANQPFGFTAAHAPRQLQLGVRFSF